jgi:hypothetical protein
LVHVAADHLEYDIHATPAGYAHDLRQKIMLRDIDRYIGAELPEPARFFFAACGCDHFCIPVFGNLNGRRTDAAATALHEHPFTGFEIAIGFETEPSSQIGGGDGSSLSRRQTAGNRPDFRNFCDHVFGVSAEAWICHDALPQGKSAYTGANFLDRACKLASGYDRQLIGRDAVSAFA